MSDPSASSNPSVLVVDDDPDIRANMEDVLSAFGYRVDLAPDGESASELAARNLYDVALVDLRMPGIDGVELYQRIKRIQAGVAVFLITAFAETERARTATEAGAWEIIPKPLDVARLLESIRGALRRPLLIVVDDDRELCLSLWDVLRQHAYRVCLAHDVEEAERKLAVRQYDAALIDLRLPGGGGTEVLQSLRKRNAGARAIVMASDERAFDADLAHELEQAGIPLFVKPLDLDRLLVTIAQLEAR
jgi:DNA-binding response OmpR family regulator